MAHQSLSTHGQETTSDQQRQNGGYIDPFQRFNAQNVGGPSSVQPPFLLPEMLSLQGAEISTFPCVDTSNTGSSYLAPVEDAVLNTYVEPSQLQLCEWDQVPPCPVEGYLTSALGLQNKPGLVAALSPAVEVSDREDCSTQSCSPLHSSANSSETEARQARSQKRRAAPPPLSEDESARLKAKQYHSAVERRYRDNLKEKMEQLNRTLESTSRSTGFLFWDHSSSSGRRTKVRKSDIITKAINYVHQSELEIRHMTDEIHRLEDRIQTLEKFVKCEDRSLLQNMIRVQLQRQP
ncbi:uncharacterized protein Z518_00631 [Rhinocladiella mackenziei CBS 650.93]|uniref:BHLH domain-containing protein n=1 Tax=Rhinocladiella mackenziei CBS 650.93 TaxID=1442369 RepID=A0A0D2J1K9_9EURO|nr:uncharacterized protein Z518_00631 [Rhinocladiella mackenziei CBS 650.93]KIX09551.1 hypothetical protein Z518_00631 [Rhinocladiella mackenziei CBS 650.93]